MDNGIVSKEGLALLYYQEREHVDHDEAVKRVADFTGQPAHVVEAAIEEEVA